MKKIILIIFFCSLRYSSLYSQPCVLSQNCIDTKYPYKFCLNGTAFFECSKNPYHQEGGSGGQILTPLKVNPCFVYPIFL